MGFLSPMEEGKDRNFPSPDGRRWSEGPDEGDHWLLDTGEGHTFAPKFRKNCSMSEEAIVGIHAVQAIITHEPHRVLRIWTIPTKGHKLDAIITLAKAHRIPVEQVAAARMHANIDADCVSQGIMAWVKPKAPWGEQELLNFVSEAEEGDRKVLLLVLDHVQDPHNLGACLRSADGFGVDAVIVPRHESSKMTPTVRKAASGAADMLPLAVVANLARTLELLKKAGVWVVGLDGEASQALEKAALHRSLALVMGAEGSGLRVQTQQSCDELASIPLKGSVSSLNVSVATGIALYEACKRRSVGAK